MRSALFVLLLLALLLLVGGSLGGVGAQAVTGEETITPAPGQAQQATQAQQAGQASQAVQYTGTDYSRVSQEFNNAVLPVPSFGRGLIIGDDRIEFNTRYRDGSTGKFGAVSQGGLITRVRPAPYSDSTLRITASEETINRIVNAPDPYAAFRRAWGTEIKVEGIGLVPQIKLFFSNIVLQITFALIPTTPVALQPAPVQELAPDQYDDNIDCEPRAGGPGGGATMTPEDRARFTNVTDNITTLQQPNQTTCSPTAGAIDLLHWNNTIAPGLVTGNASALIDDLAKRMNTSGNGTTLHGITGGLISYLKDHNASGNFTIKVYRPGRGDNSKTVSNVTWVITTSLYSDLEYEFLQGENLIVTVKYPKTFHSMKLVALNTKAENGEHLVAFADPASGTVIFGGLTDDGNLDIYGKPLAKIVEFIAISPKK